MTKTSNVGRGLSVKGKTRKSVLEFLGSTIDRRFTDAEKALQAIKERPFTGDEYKAGYVNALEGVLISVRTGDERDFYNAKHLTRKAMRDYRTGFKELIKYPIRSKFDSGFFAAWSDIMQYRNNSETD